MTIGHGDEPGEAETIRRATGFATKKRRIILMLLGYSAILGVLSCFLPQEERPMDALVALPLLILGITWCFLDAEERGFRIGGFLKLLLVLLFFVGFPAYVLQSRGLGGFRTLVIFPRKSGHPEREPECSPDGSVHGRVPTEAQCGVQA